MVAVKSVIDIVSNVSRNYCSPVYNNSGELRVPNMGALESPK